MFFHAEKKVTDELQQHHELVPLCCKLIANSMIGYNDTSRNHVVDLYMKESKTNLSRDTTITIMRNNRRSLKIFIGAAAKYSNWTNMNASSFFLSPFSFPLFSSSFYF
jgi:hypothetical protein